MLTKKITNMFTIILLLLVIALLSSCSQPVYFEDLTEPEFSDYELEQTPSIEIVKNSDEQTPMPLPIYATQSPSGFFDFLDSIEIQKAERIQISDSFYNEIIEYRDRHYDELYADQEEPSPIVAKILGFMEESVGGNYLFGGQGHVVTESFVMEVNEMYPKYMNGGRLEYFLNIAESVDESNPRMLPEFPIDYAWDCSGLWWDCCNSLNLFDQYTDRTAHQTFEDYCTPIAKEELQPGDIVFYRNQEGRITHMGIMGTGGYIYEAASGFVGVVKHRSLDNRIYKDIVRGGYLISPTWNEYGRPIMYQ